MVWLLLDCVAWPSEPPSSLASVSWGNAPPSRFIARTILVSFVLRFKAAERTLGSAISVRGFCRLGEVIVN